MKATQVKKEEKHFDASGTCASCNKQYTHPYGVVRLKDGSTGGVCSGVCNMSFYANKYKGGQT